MAFGSARYARKKKDARPNPLQRLIKAMCSKSTAPLTNMLTSFEISLYYTIFYFWVGSFLYTTLVEKMSTTDSLYFLTFTMTTVGYGDVRPTSQGSRVLTMFWALLGVSAIAAFLVEVASAVLDARDAALRGARAALLQEANASPAEITAVANGEGIEGDDGAAAAAAAAGGARGAKQPAAALAAPPKRPPTGGGAANLPRKGPTSGPSSSSSSSAVRRPSADGKPPLPPPPPPSAKKPARRASFKPKPKPKPLPPPGWRRWARRLADTLPVLELFGYLAAYAIGVALVFVAVEQDWTVVDGIYFAMITGTSIGYGDVTPKTELGRGLALLLLPCSVVFVGTTLSALQGRIIGEDSEEEKLSRLLGHGLSLSRLLEMDTNGDGSITEFEYLKFMLCGAGIADAGSMEAMHARFAGLDEDGSGSLTVDDLKKEPLGSNRRRAEAQGVGAAAGAWRRVLVRGAPASERSRCVYLVKAQVLARLNPPKHGGIDSYAIMAKGAAERRQRYTDAALVAQLAAEAKREGRPPPAVKPKAGKTKAPRYVEPPPAVWADEGPTVLPVPLLPGTEVRDGVLVACPPTPPPALPVPPTRPAGAGAGASKSLSKDPLRERSPLVTPDSRRSSGDERLQQQRLSSDETEAPAPATAAAAPAAGGAGGGAGGSGGKRPTTRALPRGGVAAAGSPKEQLTPGPKRPTVTPGKRVTTPGKGGAQRPPPRGTTSRATSLQGSHLASEKLVEEL